MLPDHKRIKTRAIDAKGLLRMAEQLRDGLCPLMSMVYEKDAFTLLVNRFCQNHEDVHENKPLYYRVHLGLLFRHAVSVKRRGFENVNGALILNLLHISVEDTRGGDDELKTIVLIFSGGFDIKIQVRAIEVYLSDLHDAWPTLRKPAHLFERAELLSASA